MDCKLSLLDFYPKISHEDSIILEQGWNFLGSSTPYSSFIQKVGSFDEILAGKTDFYKLSDDCTWKCMLVNLPR